jgi:hypothetical protein
MIMLLDKQSDRVLGEISERELEFLIDFLEEEGPHDRDYYIDAATVGFLEKNGASTSLLAILRRALGASDGIDVRWDSTDADSLDVDSTDLS